MQRTCFGALGDPYHNFLIMAGNRNKQAPNKISSPNKDGPSASSSPAKGSSPSKAKFKVQKVKSPGSDASPNPVILKMDLIQNYGIGLHITYQRPINRSPYAEHLLYNAALYNHEWATALDLKAVEGDRYFLHINNVIQQHFSTSPYNIVYLVAHVEIGTDDDLRALAQGICDNINESFENADRYGTAGHVQVPQDINELIRMRDASVEEVMGINGACRKIRRWLGYDWNAGDFEENRHYYKPFFKKGRIPPRLQTYLNAPESEINHEET